MKKSDLLNYVGRYHLAGATTSVKWVAKDGKLEKIIAKQITNKSNVNNIIFLLRFDKLIFKLFFFLG